MAYELNIPTAASMLGGEFGPLVAQGYLAAQKFSGLRPLRLHLGCGTVRFAEWVNVDIDGAPDLTLDLRYGLPFPDGCVDAIHSEHMLEHLCLADGRLLLSEACRVLRPGGVVRIGVPDLAAIVRRYDSPDWRDQEWIADPNFDWIDSPVALINVAFRGWEHQYLYDERELRMRLRAAGFNEVQRVEWGKSAHPEFVGLETRPETDLIVEAVK
jgi:predicted SAM-dependent methyltransferase